MKKSHMMCTALKIFDKEGVVVIGARHDDSRRKQFHLQGCSNLAMVTM